jgi:hypothetical protein
LRRADNTDSVWRHAGDGDDSASGRPALHSAEANSMLTWTIPKDCPRTEEQRQTRRGALPTGEQSRICWAYEEQTK